MKRVLAVQEGGLRRDNGMTRTEGGRPEYYRASHAPREVVGWCNGKKSLSRYGQARDAELGKKFQGWPVIVESG